jgi:hypothetical protein
MLFAQAATQDRNFTIYKSLLTSYKKSHNKKIADIFEKSLEQARGLVDETIDFFDVDSDIYYLVKYLARECKEELPPLNADNKITLTAANIKILETCLNKNSPVA